MHQPFRLLHKYHWGELSREIMQNKFLGVTMYIEMDNSNGMTLCINKAHHKLRFEMLYDIQGKRYALHQKSGMVSQANDTNYLITHLRYAYFFRPFQPIRTKSKLTNEDLSLCLCCRRPADWLVAVKDYKLPRSARRHCQDLRGET